MKGGGDEGKGEEKGGKGSEGARRKEIKRIRIDREMKRAKRILRKWPASLE